MAFANALYYSPKISAGDDASQYIQEGIPQYRKQKEDNRQNDVSDSMLFIFDSFPQKHHRTDERSQAYDNIFRYHADQQ